MRGKLYETRTEADAKTEAGNKSCTTEPGELARHQKSTGRASLGAPGNQQGAQASGIGVEQHERLDKASS
ncbi:hypothetical protein HMPREF0083_01051 [Aneurinibacillus aneurinilyticus ATCC 12856]|uniref:Uncharacterized protein n=1 Tax=Aneurinibacillus aneurinilyticus ATCC 12856 TaxID=649747 RepID=U1X8J7_ANEAE|nr:hypothetical protein HMPREF0083_01051 [Aneurinibacillus aneurinilyticus ATCC 12856]